MAPRHAVVDPTQHSPSRTQDFECRSVAASVCSPQPALVVRVPAQSMNNQAFREVRPARFGPRRDLSLSSCRQVEDENAKTAEEEGEEEVAAPKKKAAAKSASKKVSVLKSAAVAGDEEGEDTPATSDGSAAKAKAAKAKVVAAAQADK